MPARKHPAIISPLDDLIFRRPFADIENEHLRFSPFIIPGNTSTLLSVLKCKATRTDSPGIIHPAITFRGRKRDRLNINYRPWLTPIDVFYIHCRLLFFHLFFFFSRSLLYLDHLHGWKWNFSRAYWKSWLVFFFCSNGSLRERESDWINVSGMTFFRKIAWWTWKKRFGLNWIDFEIFVLNKKIDIQASK